MSRISKRWQGTKIKYVPIVNERFCKRFTLDEEKNVTIPMVNQEEGDDYINLGNWPPTVTGNNGNTVEMDLELSKIVDLQLLFKNGMFLAIKEYILKNETHVFC